MKRGEGDAAAEGKRSKKRKNLQEAPVVGGPVEAQWEDLVRVSGGLNSQGFATGETTFNSV